LAWFATAFYTLHTALAETINYIISRSDTLSTLGVVAGFVLYFYLPKHRKFYIYLLPVLVCAFAKPTAIMFAPLLWVWVYLFDSQGINNKNNATEKLIQATRSTLVPFILCGILYVFIAKMEPAFVAGGTSRYYYAITQFWILCYYIATFFLPIHLSADTDWGLITTLADRRIFFGIFLFFGLMCSMFWASKVPQRKPIAWGLAWFFLALLPTSSIVPLSEVMNDHRLFFPYIGLSLAMVCMCGLWLQKYENNGSSIPKIGLVAAAFALLAAHSYGVHQRNKVWQNDETLWYDVAQKSPKNGRGLMNYGLAKMAKGDYPTAEIYYLKALELSPNYSYLHVNLGILKAAQGNFNDAETYFKRGLAIGLDLTNCHYFYAKFLAQQTRNLEAIVQLNQALALSPADVKSRYLLIDCYARTGNYLALEKICAETLSLMPNDVYLQQKLTEAQTAQKNGGNVIMVMQTPEDYLNLSLQYYQSRDFKKCIEFCEKALKMRPNYAEAYNNMCAAHNELGQWKQAVAAGKKAVAADPNNQLAKNNLAWALQNMK
jgi:tetratricopeptide (TPR) repeat protein